MLRYRNTADGRGAGIRRLTSLALCAFMVAMAFSASSLPAAAELRCPAGEVQAGNGCMPAGGVYCGGGKYCHSGEFCGSGGRSCITNGDTDCGDGRSCKAGYACIPGGGCRDPNAPARNSSGCGSDITGTGGAPMSRTNCSPGGAQGGQQRIQQQRAQRQDLRTMLRNRMAGGPDTTTTTATYTYDYSYTPSSASAYREPPQVIYERVKQQCGDTPTTDCAKQVIDLVNLRQQLRDKLNAAELKRQLAKANAVVESEVPSGSSKGSGAQVGGGVAASSTAVPEQSLFCHMVLERIQSGDMQYSRDEQIPPDCRRDQEIIDALKKAKIDHPYVGVAGPDTDNEIAKLLKPLGYQDSAISNQLPLEPGQ